MSIKKTLTNLTESKDTIIVAFGDSLTQGWMEPKGYVDFLKEMIESKFINPKFSIINKGIPGDTASGGLSRCKKDVIIHNPDLTIIQFALNDMFIGMSEIEFYNNTKAIIKIIQSQTESEIILTTSVSLENPGERSLSESFYKKLFELSQEYNTAYTEVHSYWDAIIKNGVNRDLLVQYDRVHPTVEGYKLMAEAIFSIFE